MTKPVCKSVRPWLEANLGKRCLAGFTSTDTKALDAAIHIVELYSVNPSDEVAKAFGLVVESMQPQMQEFAFHAIAHSMDWGHRFEMFVRAGLDIPSPRRSCEHEPKGGVQ